MEKTLNGKIALVTGGSRNIGRLTALELAEKGADVILTYRSQADAAATVVAEIEAAGNRAKALQADFSSSANIPELATQVEDTLRDWSADGFDILINNAGTLRIGGFEQITGDDLDAIYTTNFKSVVLLTQALASQLRDGGRIVNLSSGLANGVFPPLIAYGPLKAALQAMTLYWAQILGPRQITVNAVAPGGLDDDFNARLFDEIIPGARDYVAGNTALGRVGLPEDVSGVIGFLCDPKAAFVTGAILKIDGGFKL
ncbi:SDR family NAD(P)-dependent oxidoreductase [Cognatiyoonia sp. IB215182]|uniref:SDR family NAD(P)-dependent oxidoreductase n=1 Tax=Cognatiyoonia sp. IB215182 TaxID=3097353 RepID=UPI002A0EA09C|nr:SDR family oxidoreductase [Cognatiyoonia sp. IB215182]MDX8354728.1 SDR family oxidoreductase [Cognatiyoonia sp. IB215182]